MENKNKIKTKTLFVLPALTAGGAERVLITLMNSLDKSCYAPEFLAVSPEGTLKNIIDHFMEEYFWRPSGIVSYSIGGFGGVRASMQLRALLPEVGMPTIPTIFSISKVHESLDARGKAKDKNYPKRIQRFIDELEWYANACKTQKKLGVPY